MTKVDVGQASMECPICASADCVVRPFPGAAGAVEFACPRCGSFALTGTTMSVLPPQLHSQPIRRALMSHKVRRMHHSEGKTVVLGSHSLESLWIEGRLPSPQQQADSLISWIGDNQPTPDVFAEGSVASIAALIGANIPKPGNPSEIGLIWLLEQAQIATLFDNQKRGNKFAFRLNLNGWQRYHELKKIQIESRTAFMAMRFGEIELDHVVNTCFRPAVARTGFELRVLTDQQPAGLIDNQIRSSIMSGRFVIADLTHGSHGAYWEAGFAEGFGLPVIYTCKKSQWDQTRTHFDTNHLLTILWDAADLQKAERELAATIRATLRTEAKQTDA
jgi:predicted RNA-binding Zn-ribbon protein involved in translation (DUF1610 family)